LFYRSPLWSSGQRSFLQIQRSGFNSRRYQIFWEVVGLERGPLSLVSTIEVLLERQSSGPGLGNREHGRRDPLRWQRGTLNPQKLALTSPTSGGHSVGIVRSRTETVEFIFIFVLYYIKNPRPESANQLYRPRERRLSAKLVPTFADRGYHVSVTYRYGRILGFLDRSRYFFFVVAPQLYSRGWVDPVPDPLLLRISGSAKNRTRTSGSVASNSDH
jgi:hypothetical protein